MHYEIKTIGKMHVCIFGTEWTSEFLGGLQNGKVDQKLQYVGKQYQ